MTITYKSKDGLVVPKSVIRAAHWKNGEALEFIVSGRIITIFPKSLIDSDTILTPAEAKKLRHAMKQVREGKTKPWPEIKRELDP